MMLEISLSLEKKKKKKKKYNSSNMNSSERWGQKTARLNLGGGRTLGGIIKELGDRGWTVTDLPIIDMDIVMIHGDTRGAEFWHTPPDTVTGNIITLHGHHRDTLSYTRNSSLVRNCPSDGMKVIASVATRG